MKLLFLCKRFPQGRDLLTRPYGRFYHVPRILAERGHDVHVALLSYRGLPPEEAEFDGIRWSSDDLWPTGPTAYLRRLRRLVRTLQPDWIIGASDTYFGILAQWVGRSCGAPYVVDAYDDFESYIPWAIPLHRRWRRAVVEADLVTAAGPQLARHLAAWGAKRCEILPMAADPGFYVLDRITSRAELGLPVDRQLIGHIGTFDRRRGRHVVLEALAIVQRKHPQASLLVSGNAARSFHQPPQVYGVGQVADGLMPALVNSLDVACVALSDNAFGRASYPVKLCEAMVCQIPVVASATEPVRWMLGDDSRFLAAVGDSSAMAERIAANLALGRVDYGGRPSWRDVATTFEGLLRRQA